LLLGGKAEQTVNLVNNEHLPFHFSFDESSFGADDQSQPAALRIEPSSGWVSPDSSQAIAVTFSPRLEKPYNFNVVCNVRSKATRLAINVKGEGYAVHAQVLLEADGKTTACVPGGPIAVDFGPTQINEKVVRQVVVANSGKFPLDFEWRTQKHRALTILPEASSVPKGDKAMVSLVYHPMMESTLENHLATLSLNNGPSFSFDLRGRARRPQLTFSFTEHDFGACFLVRQGMESPSAKLVVVNNDDHDISYDCSAESTQWLDVDATPTVLSKGESREVNFTFTPHTVGDFSAVIPFEINGLYTVNVQIMGHGCERRVELLNPQQMTCELGSVRVGQSTAKTLRIVNRSRARADCSLAAAAAALKQLDITLTPAGDFSLPPKATLNVELFFRPTSRRMPFTQDVTLDVSAVSTVLCVVRGAASGLECKLENDGIFFGPVVANSRTTRRLQLENTGDIGTKFTWRSSACAADFTINPVEGFIAPHDALTFDVVFHPLRISDDIRYDKIPLELEQGAPLHLSLTGICSAQEPTGDPIPFSTAVRSTQTKSLPPISNPTDGAWNIKPVLDNDFWTGPEILEIPAGKTGTYTLSYTPLLMTTEERPQHDGSVFFPLPNGTAVLYPLQGKADPPPAEGAIKVSVKAKQRHFETVSVKNWLGKAQRFNVTVQVDNPTPATTIACADSVDVPAHLSRDFRVKFFTFLEGKTTARVTFTNERTGEFIFYTLEFNATPPEVLETTAMETVVRQPVTHSFVIDNPLSTPVTLQPSVDHKDVSFVEEGYTLGPHASTPCEVTYRPLLEGQGKAKVTFKSAELGVFLYELALTAAPAGANRTMQFKASLGTSDTQTFRFFHFLPDKAEYKCTCDSPDFVVETATVQAAPAGRSGIELGVDIRYEPASLGDGMARLVVNSPIAGQYLCILRGHCLAPRPQGPIVVKAGATASISFKNVFAKPVAFSYFVDNPAFTVTSAAKGETRPKESLQLTVAYKPTTAGQTTTCKLAVTCDGYPPWCYYLSGQ